MDGKELARLTVKLHSIYYKLGAYNRNPQQHANNVIESNSSLAKECLELLGIDILSLDQVRQMELDQIE